MGTKNSKSSSNERIRVESRSPRPVVAVKNQLNPSIYEFLKFYETNIEQLTDLAEKLKKCQAERQQYAGKAKKEGMAVSVFAGAGVILDGLAGGLPLAAGLASVAGFGGKAIGKITTSKSLKKLKSLWEAYKGIIKVLKMKMQDVVRGIDTHEDKRNVQDTVLLEVLKLRAEVTEAISTLNECERDSESENCKMVRQYRDQVERFKPTMERFRSPRPVKIQLNNSISEFLSFYEPNMNKLMDLAEQLAKCQAERQLKAKKREIAVAVMKGAGVALSILADGIPGLGYVARVGINTIEKVNTNKSLKKLKSLREGYRGITNTLKKKMLDMVRGIETHTDKRNAPDADLIKLLDLKSKMFYAIIALGECHQDNESENYKMVREYRGKVELFKPKLKQLK